MKKTLNKAEKFVFLAAAVFFACTTVVSCGSEPEVPAELTIIEEDKAPVKYTEEYEKAKLYLIANGSQRIVKLDSSKEDILSVFGTSVPEGAMFRVEVFSGSKKDKANGIKLIPAARIDVPADDMAKFVNGYDLFANAADFGTTLDELSAKLEAKDTYFAEATVFFTTKEEKGVVFGTKLIKSNDTVFTPVK